MKYLSKHDPSAYEGAMCKLVFSKIMQRLSEEIAEEGDKLIMTLQNVEGLSDITKNELYHRANSFEMASKIVDSVYKEVMEDEDADWYWGQGETE